MALRIAPSHGIACVLGMTIVFTGFSPPKLPEKSNRIYRFDSPRGQSSKSGQVQEDGVQFQIAVGFKKTAMRTAGAEHSYREKAQELIDKLAAKLTGAESPGVRIAISALYPSTREVILDVAVADAAKADFVRSQLSRALSRMPGVVFAGTPGKVRIDN